MPLFEETSVKPSCNSYYLYRTYKAQLFQSYFPITDIATYRLNQPKGQFI